MKANPIVLTLTNDEARVLLKIVRERLLGDSDGQPIPHVNVLERLAQRMRESLQAAILS